MIENYLKEHREAAKMTQAELARRVRVASTNISAIECGRMAPWPKVKKAIARVLRVKQSELFPENGCGKASV